MNLRGRRRKRELNWGRTPGAIQEIKLGHKNAQADYNFKNRKVKERK